LGTIYTIYSEGNGPPLEDLVGTLLGHVQVPPAGGPQIRFSIGGGDRLALQPPLNDSIPVTNSTVASLFQQLGKMQSNEILNAGIITNYDSCYSKLLKCYFFKLITGINNVLTLFCAVMTEQKILFHSRSSTRLYEACHALAALMYPFKWLHTFIPLLPVLLAEITQSPTPFLIGILSEARDAITEKLVGIIYSSPNFLIVFLDLRSIEATHFTCILMEVS
jgi:myotubularin-related protein 5/13